MTQFKKTLGLWDSVAVLTAIVIGVGIFRVGADVAGFLRSPLLMLGAWLLGGMISLLGALCYAELSSSFPKTGGNYVYLRESYGRPFAFLFGWSELLVIRAGSVAAVSFIAAEYLQSLVLAGRALTKPIAISMIIALSSVNLFGIGYGKKVHNTFTFFNISAILGIIILGIFSRKGDILNFSSAAASGKGLLPAVGLALIPILWTYGGWHEGTFVAEETRDAPKTLPRSLITGVTLVTVLYVAVNALYIYLLPVEKIASSSLIGSDAFAVLCGEWGRKLFAAVVVAGSLGCINAMIITGSRITYAMAQDYAVFAYLAKLDERYVSPRRAIIVTAVWASTLIAIGGFTKLLFFTGILVWLFFAAAASSIFILRRKFPKMERPYKVWGYPLTPLVFILVCAALFLNTLVFNPVPSLAGLGLLVSGVPIYVASRWLYRR